MVTLLFQQADVDELFKAEEATCIDLPDEVVHISLLGCLLPYGLAYWDHCLLRHCDFCLDLELATFNKV